MGGSNPTPVTSIPADPQYSLDMPNQQNTQDSVNMLASKAHSTHVKQARYKYDKGWARRASIWSAPKEAMQSE